MYIVFGYFYKTTKVAKPLYLIRPVRSSTTSIHLIFAVI